MLGQIGPNLLKSHQDAPLSNPLPVCRGKPYLSVELIVALSHTMRFLKAQRTLPVCRVDCDIVKRSMTVLSITCSFAAKDG